MIDVLASTKKGFSMTEMVKMTAILLESRENNSFVEQLKIFTILQRTETGILYKYIYIYLHLHVYLYVYLLQFCIEFKSLCIRHIHKVTDESLIQMSTNFQLSAFRFSGYI